MSVNDAATSGFLELCLSQLGAPNVRAVNGIIRKGVRDESIPFSNG